MNPYVLTMEVMGVELAMFEFDATFENCSKLAKILGTFFVLGPSVQMTIRDRAEQVKAQNEQRRV